MDSRPNPQQRNQQTPGRESPPIEQGRPEARPPRPTEYPLGAGAPRHGGPGMGGSLPGAGQSPPVMGEELLHVQRGPGTVVVTEEEMAERMDAASPDGRPPPMRDRRDARVFFWAALVILPTAVIGVLAWYAGPLPAVVAFILMLGFIAFAAWPTWHAALNRKQDTEKVKREVVAEHLPGGEAADGEPAMRDPMAEPEWRAPDRRGPDVA